MNTETQFIDYCLDNPVIDIGSKLHKEYAGLDCGELRYTAASGFSGMEVEFLEEDGEVLTDDERDFLENDTTLGLHIWSSSNSDIDLDYGDQIVEITDELGEKIHLTTEDKYPSLMLEIYRARNAEAA
jgi:hypothetical protein